MDTISILASLSLFGSGTYLGYRLAMHEVSKRKPAAPTTDFTLTTDRDGTVFFTGSITSTDFLEAVNEMNAADRAHIISADTVPVSREAKAVYVLRGLHLIFRELAIKRGN